ncbi:MAG: hypothetical protein DRI95_14990 [Bacteroidetes bacterium]|nr:MAG: hypothetical protein DRI95_14990 [Bacteroidota bacterium]
MRYFNLNDLNTGLPLANCKVMEADKFSTLLSYNTEVAKYDHVNNKMTINKYYSPTTARHQNAFLKFYGYDPATKQQLNDWNKNNEPQ